ncbi:hypothetical protein CAC42_1558 [Sphaceloma murrayae]|uniref:SMODS and SLOG-associating 2TM effector domain-containing protein n=1 Tax=Sphaceloma murrayae TaxID=2082308 RepID=A0A2K1R334_9PEZI|nr:hypothetical protein CAC42_1558 [Sphaceloma murrayae]
MPTDPDLRTPLLQFSPSPSTISQNHHLQFCTLIGMPPLPHPSLPPPLPTSPHRDTLYQRVLRRRRSQNIVYLFTASLANTLLLSQVVLGAALTALGASQSSHVLITVFGAANTIIAGLVAYLKSRGQPMRARMYREDLERLVDEMENSATMWLGIATGTHGYDAIDVEDRVTVRGEVARLTRLWDQAVRRNVSNDPDMYAAGSVGDGGGEGLKTKVPGAGVRLPLAGPGGTGGAVGGIVPSAEPGAGPVHTGTVPPSETVGQDGPDESPAKSDLKDGKKGLEKGEGDKGGANGAVVSPAPVPVLDPDESPAAATADKVVVKKEDKEKASGEGNAAQGSSAQGQKANESLKRTGSGVPGSGSFASPGGA